MGLGKMHAFAVTAFALHFCALLSTTVFKKSTAHNVVTLKSVTLVLLECFFVIFAFSERSFNSLSNELKISQMYFADFSRVFVGTVTCTT